MAPVPVSVAVRAVREVPVVAPLPAPFDVLVGPSGEIVTDWQLPEDQDRR